MTHLFDTSALVAHYLGESGAPIVQAIFDNPDYSPATSVLALFEFELRLHQLGLNATIRERSVQRLHYLLAAVIPVDEIIRVEAMRLRIKSKPRIAAMDILIAATARVHGAILVHRDPHFDGLPAGEIKTIMLPQK